MTDKLIEEIARKYWLRWNVCADVGLETVIKEAITEFAQRVAKDSGVTVPVEFIDAAREHSCGWKIGHPLVMWPCKLCKALEAYDATKTATKT